MHYLHQILLKFTYSKGTLNLDDFGIGVNICRPYPEGFHKFLSFVTTQSISNLCPNQSKWRKNPLDSF